MCILFTRQLTQAACGDNHDNTKYEDHVQKKEKETTVAHQSGTHGEIPRVWKGDMIIASPLNEGEERGNFLLECSKKGEN